MTIKQAYKEGFAEGLADMALTPGDIDEALVKSSGLLGEAGKILNTGWGAVKDVLGGATKLTLGAAVLAPALAGWGLGASKRVSQADLDALTDTALVKDYEEAVRRLASRNKLDAEKKKGTIVKHGAAEQVNPAAITQPKEQKNPVSAKIDAARKAVMKHMGQAQAPQANPTGPGGSMPVAGAL